jgi:benzoyl-CoA reductase/2-hydroxyglutaryl-CoA dehydratase subunit BcrC/BadD/HgdB
MTDIINTICEELQGRVNKGMGVMPKGAPRIMAMLPAHYSDPRLEYLVGELGLSQVASDGDFSVPFEETSKDPYTRMLNYFRDSIISSLSQRIPLITEACKKLNLDGVFDRFHAPCRTVAGDALIIQEAIKKELGIPVLLMEWENFDPRAYNHEEYKRKLEVFKTMLVTRSGREEARRDDT